MALLNASDNFEIESDDDSIESLMNLDELAIGKRPSTGAPTRDAGGPSIAAVVPSSQPRAPVVPSDDSAELSFDEEDAVEDDEDSEFLLAEDTLDRLTLSESQTPSAAAGGRRRSSRRRTVHTTHLSQSAEVDQQVEQVEADHIPEFAASDSSMMVKLIESMNASPQEHRRAALVVVPEEGGNRRFQLAALQVHTMLRVLEAWQFALIFSSRQRPSRTPSQDATRVLKLVLRQLKPNVDDTSEAAAAYPLNPIGVVPAVRWLKQFCASSRDNAAAMASSGHVLLMFEILQHASTLVKARIITTRRSSNYHDDDVLKHVSHRYCPSKDSAVMVVLALTWEMVGCVISSSQSNNGDPSNGAKMAVVQWVQGGLRKGNDDACDPILDAVELSIAAGGVWTEAVAAVLLSVSSLFEPHYTVVSHRAAPRLSAAVGVVCQCIQDAQGTASLAGWVQALFALASTADAFCADIVQGSTSFNALESAAVTALYDSALHIVKLVIDGQVRGATAFALVECSLSIALACVEYASLAAAGDGASSALVTETALCRWYMLYEFIGTAADNSGTLDAASDGEMSDANSKVDSLLFERPFSSFYAQTGARLSRYQHSGRDGDDDRMPSKDVVNDVVAQYAKLLSEITPCIKPGDSSVRNFFNAASQCRVQLGCALTTASSMDIRQAILGALIQYVSSAQASSTESQISDVLGVRSLLRSSAMNAAEGDDATVAIFGLCAKLLLKLLPITGCGSAEFFGITNQIKRVASLLSVGASSTATTSSSTSRVTTPSSKSRSDIKSVLGVQMAVLNTAARTQTAPSSSGGATADWYSVMAAVDAYGGALLATLVSACATPDACDAVLPTLVEVDTTTASDVDEQSKDASNASNIKYRQLSPQFVSKTALQTTSNAGRIGLIGVLARWINVDSTICDSEAVQNALLAMLFNGSPDASMVSENPVTPHVFLLLHLAVTRCTLSTPNAQRLMRSSIGIITTLGGDARALLAAAKFINGLVTTKQFAKCSIDAKSLVSQLLLLPMVNQNIETHTLSSIVHTIASLAVSERDVFDLLTHDRLNAERMFHAVIDVCDACDAVEHDILAATGLTLRDSQVVQEFWAHVEDARQALADSKHHDDESKLLQDAVVSIETLKQKYKAEVEHHEMTKQHLERSMIAHGSPHGSNMETFLVGSGASDTRETGGGLLAKIVAAEAESRAQIILLAADETVRVAVAHAASLSVRPTSHGGAAVTTVGWNYELLCALESSGRFKLQCEASEGFTAAFQQWSDTRNTDARVASLAQALTIDVIDRAVSPPRWRSASPDDTARRLSHAESDSSAAFFHVQLVKMELCENNERRMISDREHVAHVDVVMQCTATRHSPPRDHSREVIVPTMDHRRVVDQFTHDAYYAHHAVADAALDGHRTAHLQARRDMHAIRKMQQQSHIDLAAQTASMSSFFFDLVKKRSILEDENTWCRQQIAALASQHLAGVNSDLERSVVETCAIASLHSFESTAVEFKESSGNALLAAYSSASAPVCALLSLLSTQLAGIEKHHNDELARNLKHHQDALHHRVGEVRTELEARLSGAAAEADALRTKIGVLESSLRTIEEESAESIKRALEGSGLNEMYKKNMDLLKSMQKAKLQDMQRDVDLAQQQLVAQNEKSNRAEQQHLKIIAGLKADVEDLEQQLKYKESNSILSSHVQGTAVTSLRQHGEKLKEQLATEEATRKGLEARIASMSQLHQSETEALIHRHNKATEAAKKNFEEHLARQQIESRKEAAEREGQERVILEQRAKEAMAKVAVMETKVSELEVAHTALKQSTAHEMGALRSTVQNLQASLKSVKARADELEALNDVVEQKYSDERKSASMARELVESERIEHHLERQRNAKEVASLQETLKETMQVSDRQAQKIVQEEQKNNILIKKLAMLELEDRVMHRTRGLEAYQHTAQSSSVATKQASTAGQPIFRNNEKRPSPAVSPHKRRGVSPAFSKPSNDSTHEDSVASGAEQFRRQRMEAADLMAQYVESQRRYYEVEGGQQRASKVDQLKKLAARPSSLAGVKALSRAKGSGTGGERRVAWELGGSATAADTDGSTMVPPLATEAASFNETLKEPFDVPAAANQRGFFAYRAEDDPHLHDFFRKGKK